MRSSVNWALLGLVIQRPSYGYELVQRFERTYEDALELSSPSQIYTALDTLTRRSLIEEVRTNGTEDVVRQPKPHYRATTEGVRSYRQWLVTQVQDERRRSRLFALQLAVLAPDDALAVIERYEQACLTQASAAPIAGSLDSSVKSTDGLVDRLVCEGDRLANGARLAWAEYARRELTALTPRRDPRR
ncbi:MAG: PadR family transcriptional regulator [Solirubrobacteraceae bacterium]